MSLKDIKKSHVIIIAVIYMFTQGLLLLISGIWWDDWCWRDCQPELLLRIALSAGRPSIFFIEGFLNLLPLWACRMITFIVYFFITLLLYGIFRYVFLCSEQDCLALCILFMSIPVNDARVMASIFPYTLGIFFFTIAFYFYVKRIIDGGRWYCRFLAHFLFCLSFILNSCLFLYSLVILYTLLKKRNLWEVFKFADFFVSPIVFFAAKSMMFPTYGIYEQYNEFHFENILWAIKNFLLQDWKLIKEIVVGVFDDYSHIPVVVGGGAAIFMMLHLIVHKKKIFLSKKLKTECRENVKMSILFMAAGTLVLSVGIFPYLVVRNGDIVTSGAGGRDAMLVPYGLCLMIYGAILLIPLQSVRIGFVTTFIVFGILFFNDSYLSYQADYYKQVGFYTLLKDNPEWSSYKTILYESGTDDLMLTRFYTLNAIACKAYGNQSRMFIEMRYNDAQLLKNHERLTEFAENLNFYMRDFDVGYERVDAYIHYDCILYNKIDIVKLRMKEILEMEDFVDSLKQYISYEMSEL